MAKKDIIKTFIDEICSKPPMRKYPTNKLVCNHIDEIWSTDLADFLDYKTSNNKGIRYMFIINDNFSKFVWAIPLKNKNIKTITHNFSNVLTKSKRKPLKTESDRGGEWYKSGFRKFLNAKNVQHYSRFTNKGPSIAERAIRTIGNLLKTRV